MVSAASTLLASTLLACVGSSVSPPDPHTADAEVERHELITSDGATVVLHRHKAAGPPALIVHGISSNHRSWDLSPDRSLASFLAERGVDAWLLDLRGHGEALTDARGRRQWGGWTLDDYGTRDVPAAVDHVLQETGAEALAYVGHSLGGMVGAIYAGTFPGGDARLSALVAVGSPLDFSDPDPLMAAALTLARAPLPVVPTDLGAELQAALGAAGGTPVDRLVDLMLLNDIDPAVRPQMYQAVASPMTSGELRQLSRALSSTSFVDARGEHDYQRALSAVRTPTLVIAGRADRIAPVDRVLAFWSAAGAPSRSLVIAGRYTGFSADYGHLDLTMGDRARDEIYPLILDWIAP